MNHPELSQCPFNAHHYVPSSSLEEHKKKCQCAVLLGTDIHDLDMEELSLLNTNTSFLYKDSNIEGVVIGNFPFFVLCVLLNFMLSLTLIIR